MPQSVGEMPDLTCDMPSALGPFGTVHDGKAGESPAGGRGPRGPREISFFGWSWLDLVGFGWIRLDSLSAEFGVRIAEYKAARRVACATRGGQKRRGQAIPAPGKRRRRWRSAGALHDAGGRAEFFVRPASRRVGGIGRCLFMGSGCCMTHEAILPQVLKNACCRAT